MRDLMDRKWLLLTIASIAIASFFSSHAWGEDENALPQHQSADEAIKQKLDELLHQPNSVLNKMQTFQTEEKVDDGKPKLRQPLQATVGGDILLMVTPGSSFNPRVKSVAVRIENRSDETLVMNGDRAYLSALDEHSPQVPCLAQSDLDAFGRPPTTIKAKIKSDTLQTIGAAVTVGAIPTAEGIIKEHGPIKKRYEWDEQRREREETRLGKRLLYPGDKTEGLVYFRDSDSFSQKFLTIPVTSFYNGAEQASLRKPMPPDH